jgi:hypothetical protein
MINRNGFWLAVVTVTAVVLSSYLAMPYLKRTRIDWSKVTIEGLEAGVTLEDISRRFGPPDDQKRDKGERLAFWSKYELCLTRRDDGTRELSGDRIEYQGKAISRVYLNLLVVTQGDPHPEDSEAVRALTRVNQIQDIFGVGKMHATGRRNYQGSEEHFLQYGDETSGHVLRLELRHGRYDYNEAFLPPEIVRTFCLIWRETPGAVNQQSPSPPKK